MQEIAASQEIPRAILYTNYRNGAVSRYGAGNKLFLSLGGFQKLEAPWPCSVKEGWDCWTQEHCLNLILFTILCTTLVSCSISPSRSQPALSILFLSLVVLSQGGCIQTTLCRHMEAHQDKADSNPRTSSLVPRPCYCHFPYLQDPRMVSNSLYLGTPETAQP